MHPAGPQTDEARRAEAQTKLDRMKKEREEQAAREKERAIERQVNQAVDGADMLLALMSNEKFAGAMKKLMDNGAKMLYEFYQSLKKAGFSDEQALAIVLQKDAPSYTIKE